jgi:hypothetical protein
VDALKPTEARSAVAARVAPVEQQVQTVPQGQEALQALQVLGVRLVQAVLQGQAAVVDEEAKAARTLREVSWCSSKTTTFTRV